MITKLHHRTAQTCVRDMWCVNWFANEFTFGTYTEEDWWTDLVDFFDEEQVLEIRSMIDREATVDEWFAFCA